MIKIFSATLDTSPLEASSTDSITIHSQYPLEAPVLEQQVNDFIQENNITNYKLHQSVYNTRIMITIDSDNKSVGSQITRTYKLPDEQNIFDIECKGVDLLLTIWDYKKLLHDAPNNKTVYYALNELEIKLKERNINIEELVQ